MIFIINPTKTLQITSPQIYKKTQEKTHTHFEKTMGFLDEPWYINMFFFSVSFSIFLAFSNPPPVLQTHPRSGAWADELKTEAAELFDLVALKAVIEDVAVGRFVLKVFLGGVKGNGKAIFFFFGGCK